MSGIGIEQVEVMESTFNNEHQTPDEGEDGDAKYLNFFSHFILEEWEGIFSHLNVVVEESEDGVNTEAYAHGEEDDGPEVGSGEESKE